MPRPVIAVSAAVEQAQWGFWDMPAALVATNYLEAVVGAGARPMIMYPEPGLAQEPGAALDSADGLLLLGGPDVDPARYGAERGPHTEPPVHLRDEVEVALVEEATRRDLPTLGICRGMQLINVARGGTLEQHLPDRLGNDEHRRTTGTFDGNEHAIEIAGGSRAAFSVGGEKTSVHSHHHQAVDQVGKGLFVSGRSPDGVPESIEDPGMRFLLGVQWHPEADGDSSVVASLVEAAS